MFTKAAILQLILGFQYEEIMNISFLGYWYHQLGVVFSNFAEMYKANSDLLIKFLQHLGHSVCRSDLYNLFWELKSQSLYQEICFFWSTQFGTEQVGIRIYN
jgi:hypothetical protein